MIDLYESALDATGRFGAVFERDDEAAYFYLLDMSKPEGARIVSAFNAKAVAGRAADVPVAIRWNGAGTVAGLFVDGALSAVFDLRRGTPAGRLADRDDGRLFAAL